MEEGVVDVDGNSKPNRGCSKYKLFLEVRSQKGGICVEGAAGKKAQRTVFAKMKPMRGTSAKFEVNRRSTPDIA